MKRQIILIEPYWTRNKDPRVPLSHASLLARLKLEPDIETHSIIVAVNSKIVDPKSVTAEIFKVANRYDHDRVDVAFGVYVWGETIVKAVLSELRHNGFTGRIILGGPQISYSGPGLEEFYPEADIFVRGYGEDALATISRSADSIHIPGVHEAGNVDKCEQANVDLSALPSPWLNGTIPIDRQRFIRWETQRGCPFRCGFCQHREPGARLKCRTFNMSRILSEASLFCRSAVQEIAILDPIFNSNPNAVPILQALKSGGYKGSLSLQCRSELVTPEFLDTAKMLDVCLEFGLQTIHLVEGRAINRINNMQKVSAALDEVKRRRIKHEVSLIFGLPHQTVESFIASIQWCLDMKIPVIKAFPLMLLRGTPLEQSKERWNFRERGEAMPIVVSSNSFKESDWDIMARLSEALLKTEGSHPSKVNELLYMINNVEADEYRWHPKQLVSRPS